MKYQLNKLVKLIRQNFNLPIKCHIQVPKINNLKKFTNSGLSTIKANNGLLTAKNKLIAIPPKIEGIKGGITNSNARAITVNKAEISNNINLFPFLST